MKTFEGRCIGGPYDGALTVHYTDFIRVVIRRPMPKSVADIDPYEYVQSGTYKYDNDNWNWIPPCHSLNH